MTDEESHEILRFAQDDKKRKEAIMQCPIDKTEMRKGNLVANGSRWKERENKAIRFLNLVGGPFVEAWRCPKCGKIELTTEV